MSEGGFDGYALLASIYRSIYEMEKQGLQPTAITLSPKTYIALLEAASKFGFQFYGRPTLFGRQIRVKDLPRDVVYALDESAEDRELDLEGLAGSNSPRAEKEDRGDMSKRHDERAAWLYDEPEEYYEAKGWCCSRCGYWVRRGETTRYCPNCGRIMIGYGFKPGEAVSDRYDPRTQGIGR